MIFNYFILTPLTIFLFGVLVREIIMLYSNK